MKFQTVNGDMKKVLKTMDPESIDSIVTDPPYGLSFMGKGWDHGVPGPTYWKRCYRVLKPGGYLLAFGGSRTFHRLAVCIEDAGFEIRDCVMWMYGSGFPKSMDVSKAIDKAAGKTRKTGPVDPARAGRLVNQKGDYSTEAGWSAGNRKVTVDPPATSEAEQWQGWGTALKPAWEPIIVARKPLGEKTVAGNVLKYGTGALNIDATRIDAKGEVNPSIARRKGATNHLDGGAGKAKKHYSEGRIVSRSSKEAFREERRGEQLGRWPANVILDEDAGSMLDEQTGNRPGARSPSSAKPKSKFRPDQGNYLGQGPIYSDNGGASRFFYCAKASRSERSAGLDANNHPTVKPVALMRWLVRLVTPPGGTVVDPFSGSGTTGVACVQERFNYIGVEKEEEYAAIARKRISHAIKERKKNRKKKT